MPDRCSINEYIPRSTGRGPDGTSERIQASLGVAAASILLRSAAGDPESIYSWEGYRQALESFLRAIPERLGE